MELTDEMKKTLHTLRILTELEDEYDKKRLLKQVYNELYRELENTEYIINIGSHLGGITTQEIRELVKDSLKEIFNEIKQENITIKICQSYEIDEILMKTDDDMKQLLEESKK